MSEKNKGALILTHLQQEGACTLGALLIEKGFRTRTINTPRYGAENIDPLRPDLLVVMGGPVGVYQSSDYPFLNHEIAILEKRLAADLPTIGVCLGSQLMAQALGEKVRKGSNGKEVGWNPLTLTEAGESSPAKHLASTKTNMFHWHGDTFDLPKSATLLASSNQYENQIYTYGKNSLGVQCHPEVGAQQLEEWFVMFNDDITGDQPIISVHELRKQTTENIETLNRQAKLFFEEWLMTIGLL